jgi:hypothetical protein
MEVTVKPSVGRIVHYVSYGTKNGEYSPECRAGIVTEVGQWVTVAEDRDVDGGELLRMIPGLAQAPGPNTRVLVQEFHPEACSLSVHNPTGVFFNSGGVPIEHDEDTKKPGSWHWPERVDG